MGGRENGITRSSDGRLDLRLSAPDSPRIGTDPEHLFAAAWSTCFESAIALAAERRNVPLPSGVTVDAEIDLNVVDNDHYLSARFNVSLPGVERTTAQALIDEAHKNCPYSRATRGNMNVVIKLVE
jgi:Ohr subfamily peroxiredoxin